MSPVITGCVFLGEPGVLCLLSALPSYERHSSMASVLSLGLRSMQEAAAHVIALWGIALALFLCLFTCLLYSDNVLCHLAVAVRQA